MATIPQLQLNVQRQILSQLAAQNLLLAALVKQSGMADEELSQLLSEVQQLVAANTDANVAFLNITNSNPSKENTMAAKLFSLGVPGTVDMTSPTVTTNTATMNPKQADGVTPAVLAAGDLIAHVVAPGTALGIVPAADSLSYVATRIPGMAGTEVVTSTYVNPDGTSVSNTNTYTIGAPPNLDVASIDISNSPAV
jgi:hypothetical protein